MQSRPPCRSQKAHSRLGKVVSREAEVLLRQLVAEGVSPWLAASRSEQLDAAVLKAPDFPFQGVVLPPGGSGDLVRAACDALAPVFTTSGGAVGQVSAPVDPRYAEEPGPLLDAARTLHRGVARPNLVVRIPMTGAGVQVLADCLAEGIGVDATLVFSTEKYAEVLDAYVDGMERALVSGRRLACISAVTTFPVGAFEQEVDARLERLGSREARGTAGQAMARRLYRLREQRLAEDWWRVLRAGGAIPPRLLWAGGGRRSVSRLVGWHTAHALPAGVLEDAARGEELHGDTLLNADREGAAMLRRLERLGARLGEAVAALEAAELRRLQNDWELSSGSAPAACGGSARSTGPGAERT
ncbi:hypothetical protein GCM10023329_17510 [Streptomyces sanyensis]|uniref:Transaldolase n=1 Tax=Streptomyces sanyensis TaxID=568869 RepID=A0ABP9A0C7_9ACTN